MCRHACNALHQHCFSYIYRLSTSTSLKGHYKLKKKWPSSPIKKQIVSPHLYDIQKGRKTSMWVIERKTSTGYFISTLEYMKSPEMINFNRIKRSLSI